MPTGTCKLTGERGKFVKSHIIPKSLTRLEKSNAPIFQAGFGQKPKKRWDSWYDKTIVTREGEDHLSEIDDLAVKALRNNKLVWSGWGPKTELGTLEKRIPGLEIGTRIVATETPEILRLFFLSLLWRSAVSSLPEFKDVELPKNDIEKLRCLLLKRDPGSISFYPTTLIQLSNRGHLHNYSPMKMDKTNPAVADVKERVVPIFRFYFDGLIAHVHIQSDDDGYTESLGNIVVGARRDLLVSTISSDVSFQFAMFREIFSGS